MYAIIFMIAAVLGSQKEAGSAKKPAESCDPVLTVLFTPPSPQLGLYEVCTTPVPLPSVARAGWTVEALSPLDAFGDAGTYNRATLARLYGGQRPTVARGWIQEDGRFESLTVISPYPNRTLTQLLPGSLIIHFTIPL
jgi:hypothetical protein